MHVQSVHKKIKYPCGECEFQASQKKVLDNHIKSIHKQAKYPCNVCDFQASQKPALYSHIQSTHGIQEESIHVSSVSIEPGTKDI